MFFGEHKTRARINLGGRSNQPIDKDELLKQNQIQRLLRENQRKIPAAVLRIQRAYKSHKIKLKLKHDISCLWMNQFMQCKSTDSYHYLHLIKLFNYFTNSNKRTLESDILINSIAQSILFNQSFNE